MSTDIITIDDKDFLGEYHNHEKFMEMKDGYENIFQLPCDLCDGFIYLIKFRPGLILVINKQRSAKPFLVNYHGEASQFTMSFTLTNTTKTNRAPIVHSNRPIPHVQNLVKSFISYSPSSRGCIEFPEATNYCTICIVIEPWLVKQFFDNGDCISEDFSSILETTSPRHYYQKQLTITPLIQTQLHEILNCRYQGGSRRYFLEGKVLEVLVNGFEQIKCGKKQNREAFPFAENTADFVLQTRDILLGSIIDPPSLSELARKVGVNKTTLNQCFRKTYGVSIFEYLRICRLEKAKDLLQGGRLAVTEVALEVGYSHHCSFTKEFKKYFGENPISYLK